MDKDYHSKIEKEFAEYLVTIGYPKDCIVYEPAFLAGDGRKRYSPDFLIIDPVKKERLAIIEIKATSQIDSKNTYEQLRAYSKAIGNDKIPVFLVTPSQNQIFPFDLYIFNIDGGLIPTDFALFPTFPALTAEETAERKTELRTEKTRTTKTFQNVSWVLAFLLLGIIVADFVCAQYDIVLLTTERMALLGAVVALIVIPYAQKFKGLGIEWEKATKNDHSS
ncbi:MAG: hypothetical protein CMK65_11290 [Pseudoalteromonas sp.]|uniref:type I restriction enzyme HsdR N-terminal domain-containing protein n=1 Tax=Pseudoalteromonas sp. TaxID=53249 RepID=UPI000C96F0E4|nr:hypothetical protein [Pseudoalteromonas sp.]MAD04183.1 hypothetical protein [Pseudoalteromonas sp.]|tara:strand:- start:5680 stop:6345 length:666 start_codon:yes stop_codon:yes gene_type:complete